MMTYYDFSFDLTMSILAFLGLASLVFCYWDGKTTKLDWLLFTIVFFLLGVYTNHMFGEETLYFQWLGGALYAVGVWPILFANMKYKAWRQQSKNQ
ncbi:hypothetical protein [Moraxella sp.]|uniref:hypothetical protein n=1 Tax=Moraxella sp. TaxID=479 RepID=UPI0026DD41B5|nr:hypothetical protein [Moraxella sp.]MDO4895409.1 hypothetical protein [Moraxella sp.]